LLPTHQSGFRVGHSTESAITKVLSDLLNAVDSGDIAILVLLDLSAALSRSDSTLVMADSVEWPTRKPDWCVGSNWLARRNETSCLATRRSRSLDMIERLEIGR
jgi:hypothetical protein